MTSIADRITKAAAILESDAAIDRMTPAAWAQLATEMRTALVELESEAQSIYAAAGDAEAADGAGHYPGGIAANTGLQTTALRVLRAAELSEGA